MQKISSKRLWSILILLGLLPFLMRMGLDTHGARREPIRSIYRDWRWSPAMREYRSGSEFVLERQQERNPNEAFFAIEIQKDFRVSPAGTAPKVRAFFDSGRTVRGRIEVLDTAKSPDWQVFEAEARYPNNGILLGLWVAVLLLLTGQSLGLGIAACVFTMLTWASEWNILDLPRDIYLFSRAFVTETLARIEYRDWIANELGRVPALGAVIWLIAAGLGTLLLSRLKLKNNKKVFWFFFLSFLIEPLALWTGSLFAKWDADTSWLKIYAGSFVFRFIPISFVLLYLLRPVELKKSFSEAAARSARFTALALLLPLAFVISEGWGWLSAVLFEGLPESILRLKCFAVGFLLAALLGSRVFSLWLGTLAVAILVPPSRGHWSAAAAFGLLFDGLMLGWWVTPLKGLRPIVPLRLPKNGLSVLIAIAWFMGVFLSSVGMPIWLSWFALTLAVWAYSQVAFDDPKPAPLANE